MREFELVDRNLRTALQFFGKATGEGELASEAGVDLIYCGLPYGVFNMGLLQSAGKSVPDALRTCAEYFKPRTKRWSFWLCEEWLDAQSRKYASTMFATAGLRPISHPPGMFADDLRPPIYGLPKLNIVPVRDRVTREAFADVTGVCFDIPYAVCQAVYSPEHAWQGSYQGYVGLLGGLPVTIAAVCRDTDVLGIYSVGTLPEYRRRGYSEAILREVVARERLSRQPIILQSSEAGHRLYKRLGFRDVSKYSVYLTR